jgi:hypothetical protein
MSSRDEKSYRKYRYRDMDENFLFPIASPKGSYYYYPSPKPTKLQLFYATLRRLFCCMGEEPEPRTSRESTRTLL